MPESSRAASVLLSLLVASVLLLSLSASASSVSTSSTAATSTSLTTENTCEPCAKYTVFLNVTGISPVDVYYGTTFEGRSYTLFSFTTNTSINFVFEALSQNDSEINFVNMGSPEGSPVSPFSIEIYDPSGALVLNQSFPAQYPPTCNCISYFIAGPSFTTQSSSTTATSSSSSTSSHTSTTSSSSSTLQSFTTSVVAPSGQSVEITVSGNISSNEISNMALQENSPSNQFSLSFTLTGTSGTVGTATITIPKGAAPAGYLPLVYLDGTLATDQSYYSDQNNYYVTFSTHFSTHQVSIVFSPSSQGSTSSTHFTSSPQANGDASTYEIVGAVATVIVIAGGSFVFLRKRS